MKDKTLLTFIVLDAVFLICAILLISVPVAGNKKLSGTASLSSVAPVLLLDECPMTAAIVNGVFMLIAFGVSIPAILLKRTRIFLKVHTWLLIFNATFSLGVGLTIWYNTLRTKTNLIPIWNRQTPVVQSLIQQRFNCCGYPNTSNFVQDNLCTSAIIAATKGSCVTPFSTLANSFLAILFTSVFGFGAIDGLLLLSGLCVLKNRAEEARYELIDEKSNLEGYSKPPLTKT